MSTCAFTLTMRNQRSQRLCKLCRHSLNRFPPMHCLAVSPTHLQLPVHHHSADRQQMGSAAFQTLRRTCRLCRGPERSTTQHLIKLAQIVETYFRPQLSLVCTRSKVTPRPITDPVLRHPAQLLLDTLQRTRKLFPFHLQLHRIDAREPTDC